MFFVPVETGMNTLQFTYVMAWWHHMWHHIIARHKLIYDCGKIICSLKRLRPTASRIAFGQTGCLKLSQKVVQCSSFSILTEKFFINILAKKSFTFLQVFNQHFIFKMRHFLQVTLIKCKMLIKCNVLLWLTVWACSVSCYLSPLRKRCNVISGVWLSVYLPACQKLHVKIIDRIFMKILPEMFLWTNKSPINFKSHPRIRM